MLTVANIFSNNICLCLQTSVLQDVTQNNVQISWQILRLDTKTTKADVRLVKQSICNNIVNLSRYHIIADGGSRNNNKIIGICKT